MVTSESLIFASSSSQVEKQLQDVMEKMQKVERAHSEEMEALKEQISQSKTDLEKVSKVGST